MDSLIGILVLIGIFAISSGKKKKKGPRQAAARQARQMKIPFTKDEFERYLREHAKLQSSGSAPKPADPGMPAQPQAAVPASAQVTPQPAVPSHHDEPEGTVSTQGESAAEHAEHRRKILAEEAARAHAHEELQALRQMNLQSLRSAVVMSEILGKPVSLRPRGTRS